MMISSHLVVRDQYSAGSERTVEITTVPQLRALVQSGVTPSGRLVIRLPGVASAELRAWENEVGRALGECGCALARRYAFGALTGLVAARLAQPVAPVLRDRPVTWRDAAAAITGAALIGKSIAVGRARRRALGTLASIEERISTGAGR